MIQQIIMHKVSYRGEATGWVLVWHWKHDDLLYHTDAEPNNKIYHTFKSLKYSKRMILYSKT